MSDFDPTKHDIGLAGKGYMLTAPLVRQSANEFIGRFNTGQQGENDLDLSKVKSTKSFYGGMFQPDWVDDERVQDILNGIVNPFNGNLTPTATAYDFNNFQMDGEHKKTINYKNKAYVFGKNYTGFTNAMKRIDSTTSVVDIPLPANIKDNPNATVKDAEVWQGYLWVCPEARGGATQSSCYKWDGTTWSLAGMTAVRVAKFRGVMYCITRDSELWVKPSVAGAATKVTDVGEKDNLYRVPTSLFEYNGRLYIGKPEGLYAYDGVDVVKVDDYSTDASDENFQHYAIMRNILYFWTKNGFHSFNGASIELLYSSTDFEGCKYMINFKNRIYLLSGGAGSGLYFPKGGWGGVLHGAQIFAYDGVGMFLYNHELSAQGTPQTLVGDEIGNLWVTFEGAPLQWGQAYHIPIGNNEFLHASSNDLEVVTSSFDGGYNNLNKFLTGIEVAHDFFGPSDEIDVSFRVRQDGDLAYGAWSTPVTLTNTDSTNVDLLEHFAKEDLMFKHVQAKAILSRSAGSGAVIKSVSIKYFIAPSPRYNYQVSVSIEGGDLDGLNGTVLRDGHQDKTNEVAQQRRDIDDLIESQIPIEFITLDRQTLGAACTDVATTITVNSGDAIRVDDVIKINDEHLKVTDVAGSTVTVIRGWGASTAAAHANDDQVYITKQCTVRRLVNERIIVDENTRQTDADGEHYQSVLLLDLEEV